MKLTCLSKGNGFYFPPCHVLTFSGFRILLDFPIDLSALAAFSPRPAPIRRARAGDDTSDARSEVCKRRRGEKGLEACDLLKAVPWYKMVESLEALDAASIDVVLISSAVGMLGLPFLTKRKDFCGKVYATEPAARIGKLMMLELVSMHREFRQFYGSDESEFPYWLKREELELVHPTLRRILLGSNSSADTSAWQPLYSAADVNDCMKKIQMLKYCEEVCYNSILVLQPCSSGLDIGACNWVVRSPRGNMAYLGCSIVGSSMAARFDYQSLQGNELILFSDSSCSLDTCSSSRKSSVASSPATSQTMREKSITKEVASQSDCHDVSEESDKISFICSMALRSIVEGGSVLIPTGRLGIMLQLLELIAKNLESANLKFPIFIISTVAEEILSYVSVIPEWLSRSHQEKLYSREPLFHHVDLIKEKKIQLFPAIYSSKLINAWQEPCIVLCSHWSLRLGPVVNLLQRWCEDSRSLLIFEEGIDAKLALLPFGQLKMRVLQCSFVSGLKVHTIEPVMQTLRPKLLLVPEELRPTLDGKLKDLTTLLFFSEKKTQRVPSLRENYEAGLTTNLAFQLKPRRMRQETIAVARLRGRLTITNGKYVLEPLNGAHANSSWRDVLFWGSYDAKQFLQALEQIGIKGHVETTSSVGGPSCVIHIDGSDGAFVEIGKTQTVIAAADEDLASRLLQAMRSVLDCI